MKLSTSGYLEAVCVVCLFNTKADVCIQFTEQTVTEVTEVTNLPSCPANGLSLTTNCIAIVGSEIFWNSIGTGLSGEQIVSPMEISAIPEIATIEPMPASFTSTLFRPSNSYNLLIFTFSVCPDHDGLQQLHPG